MSKKKQFATEITEHTEKTMRTEHTLCVLCDLCGLNLRFFVFPMGKFQT